jgi:ketosteroid isomerase-like protein
MMGVEEQVAEVNRRFYAAFESLDVGRMEEVWLRESYVSCVHPGWPPLFGWGPVMQSWQQIFTHALEMRFRLSNVHVHVHGDLAWVLLTENIETRQLDGHSTGVVQATNIYERRGEMWYLVHHHGSPVVHPDDTSGTQLQ